MPLKTFLPVIRCLALLSAALLIRCAPRDARLVHGGYNVIFVLADTLRADHLSSYGYERHTSPFLDELALANVQFVNVRSQSACTFPSVNSMLTSKNIFVFHGPATRPGIPEAVASLPEILQEHGYHTIAVSASPIVRDQPSKVNPKGGFGRGFDVFDETCEWRPSPCVSGAAVRHLRDSPAAPFFLYLHYMDPHDPYAALREHRGRFATDYKGRHPFIAAGEPNEVRRLVREGQVESTLAESDFQHLKDLYDEEVASFDSGLRQLFDQLAALELLERTLVVVASDHGEAFYEHGYVKHCHTVYDNETRVPLVLRLPGLPAPVRRTTWVENLDIVPTLLDYLGIDREPYGLEGRTLRPVIESERAPGRPAFSAMGAMRSVNDDRYKLVLDFQAKSFALFDLVEDPGETRDLAAEMPEVYGRLLRRLRTWTDEVETGSERQRLKRAREIEAELRAVGYL